MMIEPGITKLDKYVDSRYTLVAMAAKRARMIGKAINVGEAEDNGEKPVTSAVNEISSGKVGYVRSAEIERAREWEAEKFAAIQMLHDTDVEIVEDDVEDEEEKVEESIYEAEESIYDYTE